MRTALVSLILVCFAVTAAAADFYRVVSYTSSSVTVEVTTGDPVIAPLDESGQPRICRVSLPRFFPYADEGAPVLPARRLVFEVPHRSGVRLDIVDADARELEGILPEVYFEGGAPPDRQRRVLGDPRLQVETRFARLASIEVFRRRYLAMVDLHPVVFDAKAQKLIHAKRFVFRLSFKPARTSEGGGGSAVQAFGPLAVNELQARAWRSTRSVGARIQRTPFEFSMSDSWVKLHISNRGVYCITYNDLLAANVNPLGIDPATLRIFSGGPMKQPPAIIDGGSFAEDYHFTENAVLYLGTDSGSFAAGDSILFYAVGVKGWLNDIDASADYREYYVHPYETQNIYWMTWGGTFSGGPRRMDVRQVSPTGGNGTLRVTTYRERLHVEEDKLHDPVYTDDFWYWRGLRGISAPSFTDRFNLSDPVGAEGMLRSIGYGTSRLHHRATFYLNSVYVDTLAWNHTTWGYFPDKMPILEKTVANLVNGQNTLHIHFDNLSTDDDMYVQWYEMFYERFLGALSGRLDFYAPETTATARFKLTGFTAGQRTFLFDVTDHTTPVRLTGWEHAADSVTFEDDLSGSTMHYHAVNAAGIGKPAMELVSVPSLRDDPVCPHMVIVHPERFGDAALVLRNHRSSNLGEIPNPVVRAVDIEDIYDNFSGGLKDPIAIRNYMKFLYDNFDEGGEPVISYLLLFGNGHYDARNILGKGADFVPFYMDIFRSEREAIENDEYLSRLDDGEDGLPDIAVGRMPVRSGDEANRYVRWIIDYEENGELGPWRNKVIMLADDEHSYGTDYDFTFIVDAEEMSSDPDKKVFPGMIDFKKIYLREYPNVGKPKPAAKKDLLDEWNDGVLIVNFAGHGSADQMTDELVMVKSDIYSLLNRPRAPLFLAFSCTVGNLDSPYNRSIGQELVTFDRGGAIAAIAAIAPTIGWGNTPLNRLTLGFLFTSLDSTGAESLGWALRMGKIYSSLSNRNDEKYALIGDPAMRLSLPAYPVEHGLALVDTMYTGHRYHVSGEVKHGGEVLASFNGIADIVVQEAERVIVESVNYPRTNNVLKYSLPGRALFRGTVDVNGGRFSADFVIPRSCRTGPSGRIRSYVSSSGVDGVGVSDSLFILPAPPESTVVNGEAPSVRMYFSGQATKVKPGARLIAEISDPDGIAILEGDPQSSIFLEFDGSGFPIFVTDYFHYDHGSSTSGSFVYPLPSGFSPGPHSVILRAFDNLGASATDTLEFELVEEMLYTVSDVFNFPNPFSAGTNFIFQLSSRADVALRVYNISGIEIWKEEASCKEGFNTIFWDGRDRAGDRPANGTYLYVLHVKFTGSFHREESIKGKVVLLR